MSSSSSIVAVFCIALTFMGCRTVSTVEQPSTGKIENKISLGNTAPYQSYRERYGIDELQLQEMRDKLQRACAFYADSNYCECIGSDNYLFEDAFSSSLRYNEVMYRGFNCESADQITHLTYNRTLDEDLPSNINRLQHLTFFQGLLSGDETIFRYMSVLKLPVLDVFFLETVQIFDEKANPSALIDSLEVYKPNIKGLAFSGAVPASLAKLKQLEYLKISSSKKGALFLPEMP